MNEQTRIVSWAEVDERWPGASVYFERDCEHLHGAPDLALWVVKGRLQARTNPIGALIHNAYGGGSPPGRAYWKPNLGIWVRACGAFPVVPYRDYEHDIAETKGLAYTRLRKRFSEIPELHTAIEPLKRAFEEALARAVAQGIVEVTPETTPPVVPDDQRSR